MVLPNHGPFQSTRGIDMQDPAGPAKRTLVGWFRFTIS